jgi:hypothetical protein
MEENGYAVYVEGSATREDVTKTFHWGFHRRHRVPARRRGSTRRART